MIDPNPLDESTQRLLGDFFHYDPQPRCPVCGRFGARASGGGWRLACLGWNSFDRRWGHDLMGRPEP